MRGVKPRMMATTIAALLCVIVATPASAATIKTLHLVAPQIGYTLVPGDFYELRGGTVTVESTAGNVTCPSSGPGNGFIAFLETNSQTTDSIEVRRGRGSYFEGPCETFAPVGKPTTQAWFGEFRVGDLLLSTSRKAVLNGSPTREVEFQLFGPLGECVYGAKTLKGKITSLKAPLAVAFAKQPMKLVSSTAQKCPTQIAVSTIFTSWYGKTDPAPYAIEGRVS